MPADEVHGVFRRVAGPDYPIVLGCSPFVAARQFAEDRRRRYIGRFSANLDVAHDVWNAFVDHGGRAVHVVDDLLLWPAFCRWRAQHPEPEVWVTVASDDVTEGCRRVAGAGGKIVFRHARAVDGGEEPSRFVEAALSSGLVPGAVTHTPGRYLSRRNEQGSSPWTAGPLMLPFNAQRLGMDASPGEVHESVLELGTEAVAMQVLGSGRLPVAEGLAYAALHFSALVVGTGSVQHAGELAQWSQWLAQLSSAVAFHQVIPHNVDVSETADEIVLLRDHEALRMSGESMRLWRSMGPEVTWRELEQWTAAASGLCRNGYLASLGGFVLRLLRWGVLRADRNTSR